MAKAPAPDTFAARLTRLRREAGLSMYALARLSGLSKQSLSKLEKGEQQPTLRTAARLALALGKGLSAFDGLDWPA